MSAAGRLWRRAPIWRVSVITAVAATALAAMFPPPVPHWVHHTAGPEQDGKDLAPRFMPEASTASPDYGVIVSPPPGPGRSGIIPFSGRQVPLPSGSWQQLVLARGSGPMSVQVELFGRTESNRLTGLLFVASPGPLGNAAGAAADMAPCNARAAILSRTAPLDLNDPLARECWSLVPLDMDAAAKSAKIDVVLQRGLARLAEMGVAVPGDMLALNYVRSDPSGWLTLLLVLPDRGREQVASSRLQAWVRRFEPLLHKGFEGKLEPPDMTSAATHDP